MGLGSLSHFYHVYADGNWQTPVAEHLNHLDQSGLSAALDNFGVGVVGSTENRFSALSFIESRLDVDFVAEADSGWEQVTLDLMLENLSGSDSVLYAHTKSAANWSQVHDEWRKSMTYFMVHRWRECVERLEEYDTVGCHRITPGDFWGGNYWWARSSWLSLMPPVPRDNRYQAEAWIGTVAASRFDMNPGWPDPSIFVTEW